MINGWRNRLSYFFIVKDEFQIAAPEGFSALLTAPARTASGFADRLHGLLVSIIAFGS
jgi:hypothetical protein